jgi:MFS family permease
VARFETARAGQPSRPGFLSALTRPMIVLLLLQLLNGVLLSPQRTFFPIYVRELGYPVMLISTLASAQQVMGLLGAWFGGAWSDALGRKRALMLGQAGSMLASLAFLVPAAGWFAPLWIVSGLCGGVYTVAGQSYLVDAAHPAHLGVFSALYNWGSTAGGALGSPAAGLLLERWDYRLFGALSTGVALLALTVNALALPGSPAGRGRTARRIMPGYGDVATRPAAQLLAMLRFLPTCYWGMALVLIPLLLSNAGASKGTIALYATISQVCASLGQLLVGRAADRLGSRGIQLGVGVVFVVSIIATGLLPGHIWSIMLFGTLGTTAAWSLSTLMPGLVAMVATPAERGRYLGWVHLWWNLGMVVGSLIAGLLSPLGAGLPFLAVGLLNLGTVGLSLAFFRRAATPA